MRSEIKNYYHILGLEWNASDEDIRKAYRTYAAKFHPDKHEGDPFFEERFKEVREAHEILGDNDKRWSYDITDVVAPPFVIVTQNFMCLSHFFEPFFKKRIAFVLIRMELGGVGAIRFPDILIRSIPFKAQDMIIVLDFAFHL